jgi:coenzyme F420-reducing hydrogenase beta subunit
MMPIWPAAKPVGPGEIVKAGLCIGCGSCVAQSRDASAAMAWNRYGELKPKGPDLDRRWDAFSRTCPFGTAGADEDEIAAALFASAPHADLRTGRFEAAFVGHAEENGFRDKGSSGGLTSWMAAELLRLGLVDGVAHVAATRDEGPSRRLFRYTISRTEEAIRSGACSRYYPVEMSDVLRTIAATPGRYAVVGVPCFVKAVNLLRLEHEIYRERIAYTLGLFCGHMKSARFADSIALQAGVDPTAMEGIDYRVKQAGKPANWYRARLQLADGGSREQDWWHLADGDWGAGFFQNSACNYCDDVVAETADIAFGDAWVEPFASDSRGSNVVIVRKPELVPIVQAAAGAGRLELREVDADFIAETQAAGLRQRREGLAYRLAWKPPKVPLRKRVVGRIERLPARRRLIYRARHSISLWSHRMFALANAVGMPRLYVGWAKTALTLYQGLTYSRGLTGRLFDAVMKPGSGR